MFCFFYFLFYFKEFIFHFFILFSEYNFFNFHIYQHYSHLLGQMAQCYTGKWAPSREAVTRSKHKEINIVYKCMCMSVTESMVPYFKKICRRGHKRILESGAQGRKMWKCNKEVRRYLYTRMITLDIVHQNIVQQCRFMVHWLFY